MEGEIAHIYGPQLIESSGILDHRDNYAFGIHGKACPDPKVLTGIDW